MTTKLISKKSKALATKIKPIRLTKPIKAYLESRLPEVVICSSIREQLDKEYDELLSLAKDDLFSKFTPDDIAVLSKFDKVATITEQTLYQARGNYFEKIGDPKTPSELKMNHWSGKKEMQYNYLTIQFIDEFQVPYAWKQIERVTNQNVLNRVDILQAKYDEVRKMENEKTIAYKKVISASNTLDELQKVWVDVGTYFKDYVATNNLETTIDQLTKQAVYNDSQKRLEVSGAN